MTVPSKVERGGRRAGSVREEANMEGFIMGKNCLRIISLALLLCLAVPGFSAGAAAGANAVKQASVLAGLGIIEPPPQLDWTALPMTRAQFVMAVTRMMNDQSALAVGGQTYQDVSARHIAADEIATAAQTGVLEAGGGYLRPEEAAEFDFAVKTALDALGYQPFAERKGGYSFLDAFRVLTRGVAGRGGLSVNDGYLLLYNMLYIDMVKMTGFEGGAPVFEAARGETILSFYRDIYRSAGQVTATPSESVTGGNPTKAGYVEIDGAVLRSGLDFTHALGRYIEYYSVKPEDADAEQVLFYSVDESRSDFLEIDARDIASYANFAFSYYDGGQTRRVKISTAPRVVYNGKLVSGAQYSDALMTPASGLVTLIGGKRSDAYDLVLITEYTYLSVTSADVDNGILYGRAGASVTLGDDPSKYKIIGTNNAAYDFSAIRRDCVISIARSLDGGNTTVIVSENSVSGRAEEISGKDDDRSITIGAANYRVAAGCGGFFAAVSPGDGGTFLLNHRDELVYFDRDALARGDVAFVTAVELASNIDDTVCAKLFDRDDRAKIVYFDKRAVVDGTPMRGREIADYLKPHLPTVIQYTANQNGAILTVDSPIGTPEHNKSLVQRWSAETDGKLQWRSFGSFGVTYPINQATLVLDASGDGGGDKIFVQRLLIDYCSYGVDVYSFGANTPVAEVVIIRDSGETSFEKEVSVLENIASTLDSEGDPVTACYVYSGGERRRLLVAKGYENITEKVGLGDLVRCSLNSRGELLDFSAVYDYENKTFAFANGQSGNVNDEFRLACGQVYLSEGGFVRLALTPGLYADTDLETHKLPANAFVYEYLPASRRAVLTPANADAILDYETSGAAADRILLRTHYTQAETVYIIR
ncbi:MAG: hypothetical protein LBH54_04070 [Clostridiales bacterium]|nr:hypothetical protein [Clostridiales bacterium]